MSSISRLSAVLFLLVSAKIGAGQDPLVAATKKRQDTARSLDIKFHVKEFVAKGSYSAAAAEMPGGKAGLVIPAQDMTIESDNRLAIDGDKIRFEKNHPIWALPSGQLTKTQTVAVTNGELSKVFYPGGIGTNPEVTGIIRRDARNDEVSIYYVNPLLMHFRGADPNLAPYLAQTLKKGAGSLPIGGAVCQEYQHTLSKDSVVELWYDPAGYDLKRIRKLRRGVSYEQYEIQNQAVSGMDSAPMSWVRTEYEGGRVRKTTTVTVTDIRINPNLARDEFEITFPPGTHVDDQRNKKEYRVQPSGDMRELDVYGKETGGDIPQPGTSWVSRNKWWLIFGAAGLAIIVAVIARRKFKRPDEPGAPPRPTGT